MAELTQIVFVFLFVIVIEQNGAMLAKWKIEHLYINVWVVD